MSFFRSPASIKAIFGEKGFKALEDAFDPCCGGICCPAERYTLSVSYDGCFNNKPRYDITAVANQDINGVFYIKYAQDSEGATSIGDVGGILTNVTSGQTVMTVSNLELNDLTEYSYTAFDSMGNWSNTVTITTPNCP